MGANIILLLLTGAIEDMGDGGGGFAEEIEMYLPGADEVQYYVGGA